MSLVVNYSFLVEFSGVQYGWSLKKMLS